MEPRNTFIQSLSKAVKSEHGDLTDSDIDSSVSYCDPKFGEFSTNICFSLAKQESKNTIEVAEAITPTSGPKH